MVRTFIASIFPDPRQLVQDFLTLQRLHPLKLVHLCSLLFRFSGLDALPSLLAAVILTTDGDDGVSRVSDEVGSGSAQARG